MSASIFTPVRDSAEFRRVLNLPRREWLEEQAAALAEWLTPQLLNEKGRAVWARLAKMSPEAREAEIARFAMRKDEGGEGCPIRLSPWQAVALVEWAQLRGGFGSLPVGFGKTLLTWLVPTMLNAQRPMLLLPASLVSDTHDKFAVLAEYWRAPPRPIEIVSYNILGREAAAEKLCECTSCTERKVDGAGGMRPDLIMADEGDLLRKTSKPAAKFRRVGRYVTNHLDVAFVYLTGSMLRKSVKDFAAPMLWALKQGAPIPISYVDLEEWSQAIDLQLRDGIRRKAGALTLLASNDNVDDAGDSGDISAALLELGRVRMGVQRRLRETAGVIIREEQSCKQPLSIRLLKAPDDPTLEAAFYHFRSKQKTLDDWDVSDAFSQIRHGTELGTGMYYRWNPVPPQDWRDARKAWKRFVREQIAESERRGAPLDSEKQVARKFSNHPLYLEWKEIEPTFEPKTEPVWVSASMLAYAAEWIRLNSPALIWVSHTAVGQALEKLTGVSFYGQKGLNSSKQSIEKANPRESAILSLGANSRGRNLFAWNRNLVITPPQPATWWEQMLGRTHRQGQRFAVHVDVMVSCAEAMYALEMACKEARFVQQTQGFTQKILGASWDWSAFPFAELSTLGAEDPRRARWIRQGGKLPTEFDEIGDDELDAVIEAA